MRYCTLAIPTLTILHVLHAKGTPDDKPTICEICVFGFEANRESGRILSIYAHTADGAIFFCGKRPFSKGAPAIPKQPISRYRFRHNYYKIGQGAILLQERKGTALRNYLIELLEGFGITLSPLMQAGTALGSTLFVCAVIYALLLYGLWGWVKKYNEKHHHVWLGMLIDSNIFGLLVLTIQGIMVNAQIDLWLPQGTFAYNVLDVCTRLWITTFLMRLTFALINLANRALQRTSLAAKVPVNGISQALKLITLIVFGILIVSILLDRSPVILLSGLSAMTAVSMLVFKDPIMGFVSGLQLSGYDLLAVGDWVEMPKYNADGDVIEIGLTTVKIQNWDKTIVTIPTYALMSDSFKNWRGMTQSGGRRIKRSVYIDIGSVHFLSEKEYARLQKTALISDYLGNKLKEIESYNAALNADKTVYANGRHLTNVGTFRIYLESYLRANPNIHKGMTLMVRQLAATAEGLPIEIYVFTNTTEWVKYENIQSDIFDHVYAVLPEFGLRAYQSPSGSDFHPFAGPKDDGRAP